MGHKIITEQDRLWNGGDTKEIPKSKAQREMGGEDYTNDRLNRAAKEEDGYTDGKSSKNAQDAIDALEDAKINNSEIKTEKLDIYVDKDGGLKDNPIPRKW